MSVPPGLEGRQEVCGQEGQIPDLDAGFFIKIV